MFAQSKIEGERLIAWANDVAEPTHMRCCWTYKPEKQYLYNRENLPAAQFNTYTFQVEVNP